MSYFSYTESERPQISAGPSICRESGLRRLLSFCVHFLKGPGKAHKDFKLKNSFHPSHCTSRRAPLDQSVTFSSHSDVWRRLGCIFLRVTVLCWKPSREVKNAIPSTCVGKGEETVRCRSPLHKLQGPCSEYFAYGDLRCIQDLPSVTPANAQIRRSEELLTLYGANHFHGLSLVVTRLQPFLRRREPHHKPHHASW